MSRPTEMETLRRAVDRAVQMLNIAGTHSQEHGGSEIRFYDDTDCDGECIAVDCDVAGEDLRDAMHNLEESQR